MHTFGCLSILFICSTVILQQFTDARRIPNDAFRRSFEDVDKQRMKRDIECPGPYHVPTDDNRCVWSCSEGTTPDNNSNECICQAGLVETTQDQFGRRVCTTCPAPYHVLTPDNRCVWSCSEGTTPDNNSNECICQAGLVETSQDQFGRRVCTACAGPYHVLTSDNRCVWSCAQGTTPDNNSNECICQAGLVETSQDQFGRRVCTACAGPYHVLTSDNRCVWSCAEGTTPDNNSNECICKTGLIETSKDQFGRRVCTACPGPYHVLTSDNRCVWSCAQGTTPDNNSNECICQKGLYEIGHDQFGRRVCGACKDQYHTLNSGKRCVWNCPRGTAPNPYGTDCIAQSI